MRSFSYIPALCCLFSSLGFSLATSTKDVEAAPQLSEGVAYGGPILNDDAMHIQLGADYILWLVTQEGLNTAINNTLLSDTTGPVTGMGTTYNPHFKVRSGFKVHADIALKESEKVDLFLQYIWLATNTNSVTNNTNFNFTLSLDSDPDNISSVTTSYQLYYNVLDFEIGRYSSLAKNIFLFRPFWGIRGTWQKVNWNTSTYGTSINDDTLLSTRQTITQQKTNGAGVRGGLNLAWNLSPNNNILQNLKILGTMAFSGIYGATTVNCQFGETLNRQFTTYEYSQDRIYRITPVIDLAVGLGWDYNFGGDCNDRYNVEVHALWDTQSWINFGRFHAAGKSLSDGANGNMTVQGLTVGLSLTF
jgi:hypothetical protein